MSNFISDFLNQKKDAKYRARAIECENAWSQYLLAANGDIEKANEAFERDLWKY